MVGEYTGSLYAVFLAFKNEALVRSINEWKHTKAFSSI